MSVQKRLIALCCVLLVVAVPAAVGGPTGGADAATAPSDLSIDDVEVSPDDPVPGEVVSVNATISVDTGDTEIDRIVLERADGPNETLENLWRLSDEQASVELTTRFDSGGTHYVWVNVYATTESGEQIHRERAIAVEVDGVAPNLAVTSESPVADAESTLSLSLTNTLDVEMQNLQMKLDGVEVRSGDSFVAGLAPGETTQIDLTVVPSESGARTLTATLVFATDQKDRRSIQVPLRVNVEPLAESVTLSTDSGGGSITATVGNAGNRPLEDVTVTASVDGRTLDQALVGSVPTGDSKTASLSLDGIEDKREVTVTVDYDTGTRSGTVNETVAAAAATGGRIKLTGVSVVRERGRLRISGSASNVGLAPVNGTIVSVVDTEAVTPAEPNRDFFVGEVPASDFVSFDVYATVEGDTDAIPLQVSYLDDGERVKRVVEIPYDGGSAGGAAAATPRQRQSGGGSGPLMLVGGIVAVVVVGAGAIVWRRRA
jgi:hypothetical protein